MTSELALKRDSAPSQVKYSDLLSWASELNSSNSVAEAIKTAVDEYHLGERLLIAKVWAFRQTQVFAKLGYPNFRVFAEAEFGSTMSTSRIYQWMSAFDVLFTLGLPWNAPVRESVLRPLTCGACAEDPDLLERAWNQACEAAEGRVYPTAAQVDAAVTELVGRQKVIEPAEEIIEAVVQQVDAVPDEPVDVEATPVHTIEQECDIVSENSSEPAEQLDKDSPLSYLAERWELIADCVDWDAVAKQDGKLTRESFTSDLYLVLIAL